MCWAPNMNMIWVIVPSVKEVQLYKHTFNVETHTALSNVDKHDQNSFNSLLAI